MKKHARGKGKRTRTRFLVAAWITLCGVAIALGSSLPWLNADGKRPSLGMQHTAFAHQLIYVFLNGDPYVKSVGFVVLLLGVGVIIGALLGKRVLTALGSLLALAVGGMWLGLVVHHFNTPDLPNIRNLDPRTFPWRDLRVGAWLTLTGAALGFLATPFLRKKYK